MRPLIEGEIPPDRKLVLEDGEWKWVEEQIEQDPDYKDPEIYSTDKYMQEDKEEFYDYTTRCLKCGTQFIAYDMDGDRTMNFCPCCGERLKGSNDEKKLGYKERKESQIQEEY